MTTAFGTTMSAKLTFDATTGLPSGVTGGAKESIIGGTIKHITSHFTGDEVVVGAGRTLGMAAAIYASAALARAQAGASFSYNPFSKN